MNIKNIPDSSNYDEGKLFKVNLPFTKDDFLAGNGEERLDLIRRISQNRCL